MFAIAALVVALAGVAGTGVSSSFAETASTFPFTALQATTCPTASDCFVLGYTGGFGGARAPWILGSTNGGDTWHKMLTGFGVSGFGAYVWLNAFSCPSASECVAVGTTDGAAVAGGFSLIVTWHGGTTFTVWHGASRGAALAAVSCANTSDCWAVGYAPSGAGVVLHTKNGGATWIHTGTPAGLRLLDGVSCPNATDCFAMGTLSKLPDASLGSAPVLVATRDGGATWRIEARPPTKVVASLNGITCPSALLCVAGGTGVVTFKDEKPTGNALGIVLTTANGGRTWHLQTVQHAEKYDYRVVLSTASCVASDKREHCWAVGFWGGINWGTSPTYPLIATSTNDGATWTEQELGKVLADAEDPMAGISCPTATECVANAVRAVVRTTNGGATWPRVWPS